MQKNSRSEEKRAFDCHILAPVNTVIKLIILVGNTDK